MVDFTLAEMVGGEMLFPGKLDDRKRRVDHMRKLFDEGVRAYLAGHIIEAKACFDGLTLVCQIGLQVYADEVAAEADRTKG